jgi:hypothetical protein
MLLPDMPVFYVFVVWALFSRIFDVSEGTKCLDQVKRRPTVYADMPVFHVFAIRALFPRVLAMA